MGTPPWLVHESMAHSIHTPLGACQVKRVAKHVHGATVLQRVVDRLLLHYGLRWRRREEGGRYTF